MVKLEVPRYCSGDFMNQLHAGAIKWKTDTVRWVLGGARLGNESRD